MKEAFYLFGGFDNGKKTDIIARINDHGVWSIAGTMTQPRHGHEIILNDSYLMIFGDYAEKASTEKCSFSDDQFVCVAQSPVLEHFEIYPEMFLVSKDFCKQ